MTLVPATEMCSIRGFVLGALFVSYPIVFEMERANCNALPLLAIMALVWCLDSPHRGRGDALAGRVTDGDELRRALLRDERSHGDCADDRDEAQGFGDHAPIIGPKSVARSAQSCWLFPR